MSPSHPSHALQQKNKTDIKKDQDKKKKGKRVTDTTFRALTRNLIFWEEKTQMWDSKPLVWQVRGWQELLGTCLWVSDVFYPIALAKLIMPFLFPKLKERAAFYQQDGFLTAYVDLLSSALSTTNFSKVFPLSLEVQVP